MKQLQTPILFLVFNRPNLTQLVFEQIRKQQPEKLFIAADGPRYPFKKEPLLCIQTRAVVSLIDWPCQVFTLFRDKNLGCGRAVKEAIDWFFSHTDEGIILEDDCLPHQDFFFYCERMLNIYRNDYGVMSISGANFLKKKFLKKSAHYHSTYGHIWGWATWKRAWALYNFEMRGIEDSFILNEIRKFLSNDFLFKHMYKVFYSVIDEKNDTWDAQWYFACWKHKAEFVCPFRNLITNIGYSGTNFNNRLNLHDHKTYPLCPRGIDKNYSSPSLKRRAQLTELKFMGVYPASIPYWYFRKMILYIYQKCIWMTGGRRWTRIEGYCSAIERYSKIFFRKIKRKLTWD